MGEEVGTMQLESSKGEQIKKIDKEKRKKN
jgi:hypothetical protein